MMICVRQALLEYPYDLHLISTSSLFFYCCAFFFFLPPFPRFSPPPTNSLCFWSAVKEVKESMRLRMLFLNRSFIDCQVLPSTTSLSSISCHRDTPPVSADLPLSRMKPKIFCNGKVFQSGSLSKLNNIYQVLLCSVVVGLVPESPPTW